MGVVVKEGFLVAGVVQCFGQLCVLAIFSCDLCCWGRIQCLHFCFRVPGCLCWKSFHDSFGDFSGCFY